MSINYNTQTTTTNNPGNNLTPEMKTYYDRALIHFASPKLVHAQFGQKKPIPAGNGKTIEFRKFSPLEKALVPLTEGVTPKGTDALKSRFRQRMCLTRLWRSDSPLCLRCRHLSLSAA